MKLALAGADNPGFVRLLIGHGAPNILTSYWALRERGDQGRSILEEAKEAGCWVMIDSGAYTFKDRYFFLRADCFYPDGSFRPGYTYDEKRLKEYVPTAPHQTREELFPFMEEYVKGYAVWLQRMEGLYDAYAELDVDVLLMWEPEDDTSVVWEWRELLEQSGGGAGADMIVTPALEGFDGLLYGEHRGRFRYFGLPSLFHIEQKEAFFFEHIERLKEDRVWIHGWAETNMQSAMRIPYYSIDSTTWLGAMKFGSTYKYLNGRMITWGSEYKGRRAAMKDDCEKAGVDYDKMLADDWREVNKLNCWQWVEYAKYLEGYVTNSYWISEKERQAVTDARRKEAGAPDDGTVVRHDYRTKVPASRQAIQDLARYCNTCFLSQKCPSYTADATCSLASRPEIRSNVDLREMLYTLLETQAERALFASFAERVSGTPIDQQVSREMQATVEMAKEIQKVLSPRDEVKFSAKGSGIVAKLFGGYGKEGQGKPGQKGVATLPPKDDLPRVIDVEADEEVE